mmetsp:Transcript_25742/g.36318  ORF Transcript_25742/g.36318 Transcript_25742/m.36318 type:complete len:1132 (-) Transcript_25742:170-3565(-)
MEMESPARRTLTPSLHDIDENIVGVSNSSSSQIELNSDHANPSGDILFRKRNFGPWKKRHIVLDSCGNGSFYSYCTSSSTSSHTKGTLDLHLPHKLPWVVRDTENSDSRFMIEINFDKNYSARSNYNDDKREDSAITSRDQIDETDSSGRSSSRHNHSTSSSAVEDSSYAGDDVMTKKSITIESLRDAKSLKFYFKCPQSSQGKSFWLKQFEVNSRMPVSAPISNPPIISTVESFESDSSPTKLVFSPLALKREVSERKLYAHDEAEILARRKGGSLNMDDERFQVKPDYAYKNTKMNREELRREMVLPSSCFHDLRLPSKSGEEIGLLRVEVLQCFGLPKLDKVGDTDAHVYLVCGSYAFKTDVIPSNANPMWLSKMRRACIFPIYHAYASLFAGVFDDDGPNQKDDFAGRIAVDLSRLRAKSTYDVTLPLRLSTHMYDRSPRGSLRLRFHLSWASERAALLSYIPKKMPKNMKDMYSAHVATLQCGDDKSIRNVALTVHGNHIAGKFSFKQIKSTIREINFTRIIIVRMILKGQVKDTVSWKNPAISLFVFLAWMHCVYINSVVPVPGHLLTFLLIHLMKNYARFGMDGPSQLGYVPPTWEEMFAALLKGSSEDNSPCISPLDLRVADANSQIQEVQDMVHTNKNSTDGPSFEQIAMAMRRGVTVKKRKYKLKWYSNVFIGSELVDFMVKSGYATSRQDAVQLGEKINKELNLFHHVTREHLLEDGHLFYRFSTLRSHAYIVTTHKPRFKSLFSFLGFEMDAEEDHLEFPYANGIDYPKFTVKESLVLRNKQGDITAGESDDNEEEEFSTADDHSFLMKDKSSRTSFQEIEHEKPALKPPPPQDMSVKKKKDKPVTTSLAEAKFKIHARMGHVFNDTVYEKKKSPMYKPPEKKSKGGSGPKYDVDKLLNIDMYSHPNGVVAKLGLFIEPITGIALAFLSLFRAIFNVFTWRDPICTFWVSVIVPVLIVFLHCFPWRGFMLLVGLVAFGPQNWLIRILKERHGDNKVDRNKQESDKKSPTLEELSNDQPVFRSTFTTEHKHNEADRVTKIRVPYSPIKYQRFYDWPPEPQFGRVISDLEGSQRSLKPVARSLLRRLSGSSLKSSTPPRQPENSGRSKNSNVRRRRVSSAS